MLEEIRRLPQRVIDNLDGDVGNLKVYLVQDYNLKLLNRIVNFGQDLFGDLGMDEWGLVPQIRHGNVFILKEEKKNRIIGFAILEEFQGQGLGYHLLVTICRNLIEQGFKSVTLTVDVNNPPAIKLYKDKLGFEIVEHRKDEYGKGHDRYIMELDLEKFNK